MKERPILFSGAMVRAILSGQKTQTRRVVKGMALELLHPEMFTPEFVADPGIGMCPYGQPGDRLWVREAWRTYASLDHLPPRSIAAGAGVQYEAGGTNVNSADKLYDMGKYRPPMFMPRWACRIVLGIVSVRVERLNDISEEDAKAEGVEPWVIGDGWRDYSLTPDQEEVGAPPMPTARDSFSTLWESINGADSWDANPWVWVIEFKKVAA